METLNKKLLDRIENLLNDYFQNNITYSIFQTTFNNMFSEIILKNNILEALIHALEHYEDDKDIHLNDDNYEIEQRNEIFNLLKCLHDNDSSLCKESIEYLEKKEASFNLKSFFSNFRWLPRFPW